jgi:hypothetical protein
MRESHFNILLHLRSTDGQSLTGSQRREVPSLRRIGAKSSDTSLTLKQNLINQWKSGYLFIRSQWWRHG